jgi:hypothetical protein
MSFRKSMLLQRRALGKVCDALPDDDSRQSVAQLRILSAHHGPSEKCVSSIVNINDHDAFFFFESL